MGGWVHHRTVMTEIKSKKRGSEASSPGSDAAECAEGLQWGPVGTWGAGLCWGLRAGRQGQLCPPEPLGPERACHRLGDLWAPRARAGPDRVGTVDPGVRQRPRV